MKKLTFCAAAVTAVLATPIHAAPGDVQLTGYVAPVCEVSGLNTQILDFGSVVSTQTVSANLNIKCNDADGASVTLTSSEGGLESDDNEDFALKYTATFTPTGLGTLTLNAPGGPGQNDVKANKSYPGSTLLAGGVPAVLEVSTIDTSPWAGGYSDTLTVNIRSK